MKSNIFKIEEERINFISFIFGNLASFGAFIVVVGLLNGSIRDYIVLILPPICWLIRFLEKKTKWFPPFAKYAYATIPFWVTIVLVVSNDGKYAAVTQAYFMWLCLMIAYYDTFVVLFCSAVTIFSTAGAILFFPEAMLKLDNLTIWFYIFTVYLMATFLSAILARRMRALIEHMQKMKQYEDELSYLEQLEKQEERHREFIHDINHQFRAIGELARRKDFDQITHLLEELNLYLMQDEHTIYTTHKAVNAIVSEKARESSELDLPFDAYIEPHISFGMIADSDLVAMLGNLLDNAMEAAQKCIGENRRITLRIFMVQEGRICVVKLQNHFIVKPVKYKHHYISSKRENSLHGIGIKSVEHTAQKYNGYLECLIEGDCFSAILILPAGSDKNRP